MKERKGGEPNGLLIEENIILHILFQKPSWPVNCGGKQILHSPG